MDVLAEAGVQQIYGVPGNSLNGVTDSIRASKQIQWIRGMKRQQRSPLELKHVSPGSWRSALEAAVPGICIQSTGSTTVSHVPVLAITAQIPSNEIGSGYCQETHPDISSANAATTANGFPNLLR